MAEVSDKKTREVKALPAPELSDEERSAIMAEFETLWNRSIELRDVLSKLPSEVVLKSGFAGRRNELIEKWDYLETPGLDGGLPSPEAVSQLLKWVDDVEMLIAYIVKIGKGKSQKDLRHKTAPEVTEDDYPDVIDNIEEADCVSEKWSFPWEPKALAKSDTKKKKWSKIDVATYGTLAAVGGAAIFALIFDEED